MANQLQIAGAQSEKPAKYAPLHVAQMFTGYWPNSSPLRDAAVPFLYQKFYSASRNDKIIAGLNMEISPRMTLVRRAGHSVYNSQNFTGVQEFYSFKPFLPGVGEQIIVVADTPSTVYNATGPSTKTALFSKTSTAKTRFKGVENTLFFSDGVDIQKWSWFVPWAATTTYAQGTVILDGSNNMQQSLGLAAAIVSTSVTSNVLTVNYTVASGFTPAVGENFTLYGLTTTTSLNGVTVTVLTTGSGTFTASGFATGNYSTTADTGVIYDPTQSGVSGNSTPSFSGTIGSVLVDGTTAWVSKGTAVQNLGIAAPVTAPSVANITNAAFPNWGANTYIWPGQAQLIVDSNSNLQFLTVSGATGSGVPVWANTIGATTTDGGATWTCEGPAARATTTAYNLGQYIMASWSQTIRTVIGFKPGNPPQPLYGYRTVTWSAFFVCTKSGTTSSTATGSLPWSAALSSTLKDGTVIWTNVGIEVTRTNASTSAAAIASAGGTTVGNVGNTFLASTSSQVIDSNGDLEGCVIAGPTQNSHPTWSTMIGATVTESGGPTWQNQGVYSVANTGSWVYAYSYGNSSTGDQSTASPLSGSIVLAGDSAILVSGVGSPDPQVDTIFIYRSTQGEVTPFLLASIPSSPTWQFIDSTNDPPNPSSTLNVLITAPGYAIVNGIVTNYNDPPPAGLTNLEFHAGRLWGTVGNIAYYSTGPDVTAGNGTTAFNPLNFFEVPGTIFKLWPTTVGLYLFTNDGLWIVTGLGSSTNPFSQPQSVDPNISISSYDAFTTNGAQANIYTNDRAFLLIDAQNGTSNVGFPPQTDLTANYSPASVYVTWYSNGLDQKGIITNGSNTWLNYMPAPAPETGYLWNPPATLVSSPGVVAVQSVETAPGLYSLLIGPSTSGPILKRDTSVFTDNSSAYSANAVIGSIVLAHHGQMAGVAFIGLDAIRTGTQPGVGVLLDEFQGMGASPAFTSITNPVNDPPNFPASATIFNSRYWLIQSGTLCYCRHMQIDFTFGSDTVQNELLSYTIYGTSISEE